MEIENPRNVQRHVPKYLTTCEGGDDCEHSPRTMLDWGRCLQIELMLTTRGLSYQQVAEELGTKESNVHRVITAGQRFAKRNTDGKPMRVRHAGTRGAKYVKLSRTETLDLIDDAIDRISRARGITAPAHQELSAVRREAGYADLMSAGPAQTLKLS